MRERNIRPRNKNGTLRLTAPGWRELSPNPLKRAAQTTAVSFLLAAAVASGLRGIDVVGKTRTFERAETSLNQVRERAYNPLFEDFRYTLNEKYQKDFDGIIQDVAKAIEKNPELNPTALPTKKYLAEAKSETIANLVHKVEGVSKLKTVARFYRLHYETINTAIEKYLKEKYPASERKFWPTEPSERNWMLFNFFAVFVAGIASQVVARKMFTRTNRDGASAKSRN